MVWVIAFAQVGNLWLICCSQVILTVSRYLSFFSQLFFLVFANALYRSKVRFTNKGFSKKYTYYLLILKNLLTYFGAEQVINDWHFFHITHLPQCSTLSMRSVGHCVTEHFYDLLLNEFFARFKRIISLNPVSFSPLLNPVEPSRRKYFHRSDFFLIGCSSLPQRNSFFSQSASFLNQSTPSSSSLARNRISRNG